MLSRIKSRVSRQLLRLLVRPSGDGLIRLGSDYGGWWVPNDALTPGAVAYCAGAGEDITFDLELQARGLKVTTFDPTPRAIAHVEANGAGLRFVATGWWDKEDDLRFYAPRDPSHVSHSVANLQGTTTYFTAHVNTVAALALQLGDRHVDIIKMDIEGAEKRVLASLLTEGPRPSVICVEFDPPQSLVGIVRQIAILKSHGYAAEMIENWNVTFVRR